MLCSSRAVEKQEEESNTVHKTTFILPNLAWVSIAEGAWRRADAIRNKKTKKQKNKNPVLHVQKKIAYWVKEVIFLMSERET